MSCENNNQIVLPDINHSHAHGFHHQSNHRWGYHPQYYGYNDKADYQTNAKSYYDFQGRYAYELYMFRDVINYLMRRDIDFTDTNTIDFTKDGDWQRGCWLEWDELVSVRADVKISMDELNALTHGSDGALYVLDLLPRLEEVERQLDLVWIEINSLKNRVDIIENEITLIKNRLTVIEGDIITIKNDISNIKGDITNIYNTLDAITGSATGTLLTKGTHYNIVFYNGFGAGSSDDLDVRVLDTGSLVMLTIQTVSGKLLTNPDLTNNVYIRHGATLDSANGLRSRIFGINFLGTYAWLNAKMATFIGGGAWNTSPIGARGCWNATTQYFGNFSGQLPLCCSLTQYIDGFNSQFTRYDNDLGSSTELSLSSGNEFMTATFPR